jgi:lipid II:glycine glycyltransferase (peptidoglycan interpeptide bridge formation enzyme)
MNYNNCEQEIITDSFELWDKLFSSLPDNIKSPFFSSKYYQAYSNVENEKIECFCCYKDDNNFLFYPYIRKEINALGYKLPDKYFDISGAYGYNGPIGNVSDPDFLQYFNNSLKEYLSKTNVVTEFVRYCPIIDNRKFHTYPNQIDVLDNIYIDLSKGIDEVWNNSFEKKVRSAIRKAESYQLVTEFYKGQEVNKEQLSIFYDIYINTMQRNLAEQFYYFEKSFFESLLNHLGNELLLSITYLSNNPISTELVLIGPKIAYGFLGGTLSEYYQYKANTFLMWKLFNNLITRGIEIYTMGGGATRGDSIYKFKQSFSKHCNNPFFIGTYVHLPEIYNIIISQWVEQFPLAADKYSYQLQGYRHQFL